MRYFLFLILALSLLGCGPNRTVEKGRIVITAVAPSAMITVSREGNKGAIPLPQK